ncbi:tRNA-intron endonuclease catalytic domain-like protein [Amanita rubescens]|nr:tRNA-intron endonuclease catalytic domain-like protein [Amanita rubescens]
MDNPVDRRIPLIVAQQVAYVWDVNDIATLRSEHRICGILTGTLPHLSQQNVFLGIPLVLMPEETVYLVDKGAAVLVNDPNAYQIPDLDALQSWVSEQETLSNQAVIANDKVAKGAAASERALSEEAIKKRQEREQRRAKDRTSSDSAKDLPSSPATPQQTPSRSAHNFVIPASSTSLQWHQPRGEKCLYTSIKSAIAAGIWSFPSNPLERARCGVFRDLHEKGYFLGGGIKFGGQYLVYPGDPLRYHSHFVATVHESISSTLRPMEIVAHGRLGTGTKKTHLLCGWDDEGKKATYLSIEWAGFG